jgi:hypothetical protein
LFEKSIRDCIYFIGKEERKGIATGASLAAMLFDLETVLINYVYGVS